MCFIGPCRWNLFYTDHARIALPLTSHLFYPRWAYRVFCTRLGYTIQTLSRIRRSPPRGRRVVALKELVLYLHTVKTKCVTARSMGLPAARSRQMTRKARKTVFETGHDRQTFKWRVRVELHAGSAKDGHGGGVNIVNNLGFGQRCPDRGIFPTPGLSAAVP